MSRRLPKGSKDPATGKTKAEQAREDNVERVRNKKPEQDFIDVMPPTRKDEDK